MIDSNGEPNNGPFEATETCIVLDADTLEVRYNFDYYMYGQFMKFIERDAVRIDSGENLPSLQHVAFRNPGGSIVLIVVNQTERDIPLAVSAGGTQFNAVSAARSVTTYRAPAG